MSTHDTEIELTEEEFEEYVSVALANGFSKGTANITPADMKRLRPLLNHYKTMAHPFRACVKDNKKRFGPNVNKYCAVIKDLIEGTTDWRKKKKNLSEETLAELFSLDVDRDFVLFASELSEEEIQQMIDGEDIEMETNLAEGDLAWDPAEGYNYLKTQLEAALNSHSVSNGYSEVGYDYWVNDVGSGKALVCEKGKDYFVVPFSYKKGVIEVGPEQDWIPVTTAWVEEKVGFSDEPTLMAEMYFADQVKSDSKTEDGLLWKTILREGEWKFSPGPDSKAKAKKLTVTKEGSSDANKLIISMSELKKNFEAGAVEHVTIPTSHADTVLENTGFIRKLRIGSDDKGRAILEAGMEFTEPEVKGKAERGTIANTSAGVLFDYIHKEKGKKFKSVLAHAALTNRPWINGMKPFGVQASDELEIVGFSEELIENPADAGGGDNSMSETTFDLSELGFESIDDVKAALSERSELLSERASLRAEQREREINDLCKTWQEEGKTPALVAEAKAIMMADEGVKVLNLSEDQRTVELSASDIVERLVNKSASVKLDQEVVADEVLTGEVKDTEEKTEVSHDVMVLASQLYIGKNLSMEDAIAEATKTLESTKSE